MYTIIYTAVDIKFLHPDHFNYNNEIKFKIYEYFFLLTAKLDLIVKFSLTGIEPDPSTLKSISVATFRNLSSYGKIILY
jgi:hypothetical protein